MMLVRPSIFILQPLLFPLISKRSAFNQIAASCNALHPHAEAGMRVIIRH